MGVVRADDIGTQLAGIVGILEHAGFTVGQMFPQRQVGILGIHRQRRESHQKEEKNFLHMETGLI